MSDFNFFNMPQTDNSNIYLEQTFIVIPKYKLAP